MNAQEFLEFGRHLASQITIREFVMAIGIIAILHIIGKETRK